MKQKVFLCFLAVTGVLLLSASDGYSYPGYENCQVVIECGNCHYPGGQGPGDFTFCERCPSDPSCATPECTVDADCDNGVFCDGAETCDAGTCVNGTPPTCDDGVACTEDTCNVTSDACVNTPDDTVCYDDNVCTGTETCDATLGCQAGTPLDCDDQNLCTTDSCDSITGCANDLVICPGGEECDPADGICKAPPECTVNADCDDNIFCNGAETCDAGTCVNGTPPTCDDGVGCTMDTCDEINDECVNTPDDFSCPDDGLFCTGDEICDSVAGCVSTGDPCPEGMTCNEDTDTCDPSGKNVKGLSWLMLLLGDENNLQVCGNGKLEANEECDDGNLENGDGCESNCKVTNRIVFITSNSYTGNMGGLDGADSICNQLASAAQLTGTYKAWLSDDTSSPAGRFTHYGQFVLVDGDPVANDWEDLTDGTIMNPINIDENGNNFPEEYLFVWSNTDSDGSVYETTSICLNWTTDSPDERGRGAYPALTDYRWTRPTYTNNCGNTIFRIYCFEQ